MKKFSKYSVTIFIAAVAVGLIQLVCSFMGFDVDVAILIDVASVVVAVLVVLGVITRTENTDIDLLKGQIKDDIGRTLKDLNGDNDCGLEQTQDAQNQKDTPKKTQVPPENDNQLDSRQDDKNTEK